MGEHVDGVKVSTPFLTPEVYDLFMRLVKYVLPGIGTLYFTIAQIWDLRYGEQVIGTTAALALFLGVVLGASKASYNNSDFKYDGDLVMDSSDANQGVLGVALNPNVDLETLQSKKEITLKIK